MKISYLLMRILLCIFCSAISLHTAWAQERVISGRVTSAEKGEELPGVSVTVKGNNRIGTVTDATGNYKISVPQEAETLVFTFVGMKSREVSIGNQATIDVVLQPDVTQLKEVVVTALGIERSKESVNYAVQEVKGEVLTQSQQPNLVNALQGQAAGVMITNSGGTPGGGSNIMIRGVTSLEAGNSPLFVIDGIPVDNSTLGEVDGSSGGRLARSVNTTNRAADINPNDIESVSILKGPAAAALYGLRASNGAILITTKKGTRGTKNAVTYSNSFSWDVYNKLPQYQKMYGQGTSGIYDPTSRLSWGSPIGANEKIYNNMEDFFQTGHGMEHNLSFTGGNEKSNFFTSINYFNQVGIVPNTDWRRISARMSGGTTLNKYLNINGSVTYVNSGGVKVLQGPGTFGDFGASLGGYFVSIMNWPITDDMANWQNPDGTRRRLLPGSTAQSDIDNPYFAAYRNPITDINNRVMANTSLSFTPLSWLNLTYRVGTDFYNSRNTSLRAVGTSQAGNEFGAVSETEVFNQMTTSYLFATAKKDFGDNWKGDITVGNSFELIYNRTVDYFGRNFLQEGFNTINNTALTERKIIALISEKRHISLFATANLSYKNILYLNLTGRNDWSSTMPVNARSFFYPSLSVGYSFSDMFGLAESTKLSRGKLKFSVAAVGKDAAPYRTTTALTSNTANGGGLRNHFWIGNPNIKPEYTTTTEVGAELGFFKNRLRLDVTLYRMKTRDNIIAPRISQGTGGVFAYINGGDTENKGIEAMLNITPVQTSNFKWETSFNFSRNVGKLVSLPSALTEFYQSDAFIVDQARGGTTPGKSTLGITGTKWMKNDKGQLIISATGYPQLANNGGFSYLGDRAPRFMLFWNNNFTYKAFTFGFLVDVRYGNKVVNGTEWGLLRSGQSTRTEDRYKQVVFEGVVQTKNADGTITEVPNTRPVELTQTFFSSTMAGVAENYIEDGSWLRLRTLSLSYRMPKALLDKTPFGNVEVNLTGRNLFLLTPYSGMDPEVSAGGSGVRGGGGSMGMEYAGVPSTRGFNIGLKCSF